MDLWTKIFEASLQHCHLIHQSHEPLKKLLFKHDTCMKATMKILVCLVFCNLSSSATSKDLPWLHHCRYGSKVTELIVTVHIGIVKCCVVLLMLL